MCEVRVPSLTRPAVYSGQNCVPPLTECRGTLPSSRRRPSDPEAQRCVLFLPGSAFPTMSFHASASSFRASAPTGKGGKSSLAIGRIVLNRSACKTNSGATRGGRQ
jgi:hypothetical protein